MWLTRCPQYLTSALRQAAGISCLDRHTTYISTFSTKYDDKDDGYLFFFAKNRWYNYNNFSRSQVGFFVVPVGFSTVPDRFFIIPGGFSTVPCPCFTIPGRFSFFSRFHVFFYRSRWDFMIPCWFLWLLLVGLYLSWAPEARSETLRTSQKVPAWSVSWPHDPARPCRP